MDRYKFKTRGHPKGFLNKTVSLLMAVIMLALIFDSGRGTKVLADSIDHTHIWATTYDKTNHWEYCTVCGKKRNVTAHVFTDHWQYPNQPHCNYTNYSTRACDCGYSYVYRESHTPKTTWTTSQSDGVHVKICSKCGNWLTSGACTDSNGVVLTCTHLGTCATCGTKYIRPLHSINGYGTCGKCGTHVVDVISQKSFYSSDHKTLTWTATVKAASGHTMELNKNANAYWSDGKGHWSWLSTTSSNNSDGSITYTNIIKIDDKFQEKGVLRFQIYGAIDGYSIAYFRFLTPGTYWSDIEAPVVNTIDQKDQASANGWATIKQLIISGTENTSDTVWITVSDKLTGEKYVTNAAVNVVDGKYSYTCTPPIEGDASGRTYVVTATDRIENSSTKEFTVSKTDGSAPTLKSGTSLNYTNWTTSKDISLSFFDFGAGGVEASLDNQTDYKALTKSGEYYVWSHSFGNQVGTSEHTIYVKDALGNATSYKLTVGNTDSTAYKITYNLNGGSMSCQKTNYTVADSFMLPQPTKTGYTFTGWTGSNGTTPQKTVTVNKGTRGNLNYTANWSVNQYSVTYNANGGTGTMSVDTATYNENYVTKSNQFTKTGYEFVGWTTNADGSGSSWTSWIGKPWKWTYTKNITLYAQWKAKTYTITYEPNGGVGDRYTQIATYDAYFKTMKNRFTRTGYTFAGFIDLNGHTGSYARLSKKSLLNDVFKHPWNLSKVDSEYQFYNYTNKVWETYCLIYWEGPYNLDYGCHSSNFTMSAKWWANHYTVKLDYKKNISSSYEKKIVTTYDSAYGELPQPVLPGWTFKGWNTKADGTGTTVTEDTVYKIAGDSTLYAQWQYNPVSVKVPQVLTGDHAGKSQFRVKCDDFKAGSIKVTVPNSFLYKQAGKADVTAAITSKSGNNIITPTNKVCTYDITTQNGLTAGCWSGNFNIGLTLTKE